MRFTYSILSILILMLLHRHQTTLFVGADHCSEPPVISFEDYTDTVNAQTNSARLGWYESLDESEIMPGTERYNLYLYRNGTRCHHRRHYRNRYDISSIANCPFTLVDNINESRFPRRLSHALCLCDRPRRIHSDRNNGYVCQSVVQYVSVFRKEGCSYIRYWEPVPVACVAVAVSSLEAILPSSSRILTGE